VQVALLTGVRAVAGGSVHSLGLLASGAVWAWGANTFGQFGAPAPANSTVPVFTTQGPSLAAATATGIFRAGLWVLDYNNSGGFDGADHILSLGQAGDIAVTGDWNGDGHAKMGIFRNGLWVLDYNGNGVYDAGDRVSNLGQAGDIPVVGDWNGD